MRSICRTARALVGASVGLLGLALPALAVEPLKGKTVTILVGTSPGGGYDSYARMLARYLPKHLPGSSVVVKNMTGGGGLRLATYLYGAAPADGCATDRLGTREGGARDRRPQKGEVRVDRERAAKP